jgi:hypothetical protein
MSILRADSIRDRAGTGAPDFPNGLTGNLTGTASTATLANTATVATNAQGLTGTPNITVGTVTGTDATFSGNLTVNGTTTTIDTAVTAVDSLSVDGNITGGGNLNLGDNAYLHIGASNDLELFHNAYDSYIDNNVGDLRIRNVESGSNNVYVQSRLSTNFVNGGNNSVGINSTGTAIFKRGLAEKYKQGTTLAAASNNVDLTSGNVHRFTTNATSGAKTVNFTGVHSTLANGESVSFTVILTPNNSGYINAATVDGVAPYGGLKWSGGSAPSAGGASGRDVYTFTIFKDGSATNSYEIFGAVTNYA